MTRQPGRHHCFYDRRCRPALALRMLKEQTAPLCDGFANGIRDQAQVAPGSRVGERFFMTSFRMPCESDPHDRTFMQWLFRW